jgi:hypothetical protein
MQVRPAGFVAFKSVFVDKAMLLIVAPQSSVHVPLLAQEIKILDPIPPAGPHHRRQPVAVTNIYIGSSFKK